MIYSRANTNDAKSDKLTTKVRPAEVVERGELVWGGLIVHEMTEVHVTLLTPDLLNVKSISTVSDSFLKAVW